VSVVNWTWIVFVTLSVVVAVAYYGNEMIDWSLVYRQNIHSDECSWHLVDVLAGEGIPTVFIAVAGRSNGLGPVLSGNSTWPVLNCPPLSADWGSQDVWSSLRLPSGIDSQICQSLLSLYGLHQSCEGYIVLWGCASVCATSIISDVNL
jgi:hypothetical protein